MPLVAHQQWSFSRGEPLSAMPLHVCTVCTMAEFGEFCPKNNIFPFDGSVVIRFFGMNFSYYDLQLSEIVIHL